MANQSDNQQQQHDAPGASAASVDAVRVAKISRAIDAGRYTIDPDRIAEQLIDRGFPKEVNPE